MQLILQLKTILFTSKQSLKIFGEGEIITPSNLIIYLSPSFIYSLIFVRLFALFDLHG